MNVRDRQRVEDRRLPMKQTRSKGKRSELINKKELEIFMERDASNKLAEC